MCACLDTGELYVHEKNKLSVDPYLVIVGYGKMSVEELIENIEETIDYLEQHEAIDENGHRILI